MSVVDEPKQMTELDQEGSRGFPECPKDSYSNTYDSISMFSGYLNYSDTVSMDSWYPNMGITNPSTKPGDFMDRPTPSTLPWNEIHDWYGFCADKGMEPYFRLGEQWLRFSVPQRVYLDEDKNPQGTRHPCLYPGQSCWRNTTSGPMFSRSADLNRHYIAVHRGSPNVVSCDYSNCSRQNDPFTRKDHCRDHYKEYHKEDIGEFKGYKSAKDSCHWEEKQREWEVERKIDPNWWRCPKCLDRVEIKNSGWKCTTCGRDCDIRRKMRRQASTKLSTQIPVSPLLQSASHENHTGVEVVEVASKPEPDSKMTHVGPLETIKLSDSLVSTPKTEATIFPNPLSTSLVAGEKTFGSPITHLRGPVLPLQEWASESKDNTRYSQMVYGLEYVKEKLASKDKMRDADSDLTQAKVEPGLQFIALESPLKDLEVDGQESITKRKRQLSQPKPPRYDCPITKRAICNENDQSSQNRGCAPMGLEFRHVWQHIKNAHYGCETCGKSLKEKNADRKHLREREKDPEACTTGGNVDIPFEVGMDRFDRMEIIYEEKLPHKEKWIKWWQVTHPSEVQVPDPLHHGKIIISAEDIPQLQALFNNMWLEEPSLPSLDDKQTRTTLGLVEKLFQLFPTLDRHRHRRQRTKAPTPTSTKLISSDIPQPSVLLASSQGVAQVCDWAAIDLVPEACDANSAMDYFQTSSGSNDWNFDDALETE